MRDELIRLWHLARVALDCPSRYDRMQYVKSEYEKAHPGELSGKALWQEIDAATRVY